MHKIMHQHVMHYTMHYHAMHYHAMHYAMHYDVMRLRRYDSFPHAAALAMHSFWLPQV